MKIIFRLLILLIFTFFGVQNFLAQTVLIKTSEGDIKVKLEGKKAPATVANFLKYVDEQLYDEGSFYRVVRIDNQQASPIKIQVIQGGKSDNKKKSYPPIDIETTQKTGLKHKHGTISMARGGPNTATSEFFICIEDDQPQLDFGGKRNPDGQGFAAFGKVVKGMDVVKKIQQGKTTMMSGLNQPQKLIEPVKIISIRRVK